VLYPFTFEPIYKERVWGGHRLAELYGRALPSSARIGESWEISDRPGDESVIANGPLAGRTLRWLMTEHGRELLGSAHAAADGRFPILCKILDARDRLSLQVHPPSHMAAALGGEPKTEMWYIAEADANAHLFVGLRRGVTREMFADKVARGDVAECFHRIPVHAGDTMFLPSGRVHAIGAGLVIFEIQQNSDTTYRVFDWNRSGLDGQPRELHVEQSMASIDFDDFEPALVHARWNVDDGLRVRELVRHDVFHVAEAQSTGRSPFGIDFEGQALQIVAVIGGRVEARGGGETVTLQAGQFALFPSALTDKALEAEPGSRVLLVAAG
jgi:mannose-6-phosphate isomerase